MEEAYKNAEELAVESGFEYYHFLDVSTIQLLPEVRQMCEANTCGKYGASWACPPACCSLEEGREKISHYRWGIVVQTVGQLEDSLDFEGIMEAEETHKEHFHDLMDKLREKFPGMLAMGAGTCTICAKCSYPDAPCRFPDRQISSVEAFGILVNDMVSKNGLKYNYGPNTIAYTSCCLLG